ncbi:hypothetical protein T484DRAFT_1789700, partial [Baffinella frigidus]
EGRGGGERKGERKGDSVEEAARDLSRLLEAIAADRGRLSKYAPELLSLMGRLSKYAPELLSLMFRSLETHPPLWAPIKAILHPGVCAVISSCGPHELQQVHMLLPEGARTLFAAAFHDYRRAFKYAGEA